tara:strand:- start:6489 stop:6878 length:390 start_codon:yes stop_codon:yes gene_type:complete
MHIIHRFVNPSMNIFLSKNLFLHRVIDWFHSEINPIKTSSLTETNFSATAFTNRVQSTIDWRVSLSCFTNFLIAFDFNLPIPEWLDTFDPDIENWISRWNIWRVSMMLERTFLADLYSAVWASVCSFSA